MFQPNLKFLPKKFKLPISMNGSVIYDEVYGIGLYNETLDIILPTPLSTYIRTTYRGKSGSLSSQKSGAYELTKFLNFILEKIEKGDSDYVDLTDEGLSGLRLIHGSEYITKYTELTLEDSHRSPNYVYTIENYLINFYNWLKKNSLIQFESTYNNSPFNDYELGTRYPTKDERININLSDFGSNRLNLVLKFIDISLKIAPEISLGICFQFFGGLRIGEVVNLTKEAITKPLYWSNDNGSNQFILEIRDRQNLLFGHKKNWTHEQVKRPRNQAVMVSGLLSNIYTEHKKYLASAENSTSVKEALFISPRGHLPMSGKNYIDKFNKVKKAFLTYLSQNEQVEDYLFLTAKPWSTHICRGVFTNILLSSGMHPIEVAIARGDKNTNTIMKYIEELNSIQEVTIALNKLYKDLEYNLFDSRSIPITLEEMEKKYASKYYT
ncbi:hypothetical protein MHI04_15310 [Lysinibacillus sp. FSL K6-1151]|uniref:hypothetical protein n=1 Tax=Lysinibacillus sp. FSL K6-1151 TaxID=2921465 RepID=UPI00315AB660